MKRPSGVCKDCWVEYQIAVAQQLGVEVPPMPRWRPAPEPGPRCVTHGRVAKAAQKARAHDRKVETGFGIPADLYWALYEFQGGHCAILHCRATGKTKHLAVDHDHKCCPGRTSCGKCVRGLLCGPHNEQFGRNGDDPSVFRDMADYLEVSTMDRFRMRARIAEAYDLAEALTRPRLVREACPPSCEFKDTFHTHGGRMYQPEEGVDERTEEAPA